MNIPPLFVRVIRSTYSTRPQFKNKIGKILQVASINYDCNLISLLDEEQHFGFTFSDVQIVFPECVVDGYVLGVGDKIHGEEVITAYKFDGYYRTVVYRERYQDNKTYWHNEIHLSDITPLYPSQDTIEVNGKTYKKVEVLDRLSELKPVK